MSDQQCAFDNWEEAAEEVANTQQQPAQQIKQKKQPEQVPKQVQQTKVEQAKQTLKDQLEEYKQLSADQFEERFINNFEDGKRSLTLGAGKVLKNDKDFVEFAKQIGEKLCEGYGEQQTLDEESLLVLFQELFKSLYHGMEWENYFELQKKLKVIKNQRKNDEKKILKQNQRKKAKAEKQQSLTSSKVIQREVQNKNPVKDDPFEGVGMNSKLQQQQRKKKAAQKKAEEKTVVKQAVVEDDDDFM